MRGAIPVIENVILITSPDYPAEPGEIGYCPYTKQLLIFSKRNVGWESIDTYFKFDISESTKNYIEHVRTKHVHTDPIKDYDRAMSIL